MTKEREGEMSFVSHPVHGAIKVRLRQQRVQLTEHLCLRGAVRENASLFSQRFPTFVFVPSLSW